MKSILIIEDDRRIAMALTLRLKSAGYKATTAYDALTGVDAVVKNLPDLVILDIYLPTSNGFEVAEKIQTLVPTPIPIIFVTASRQPGFLQKAKELGAAGYFEKPYEAEVLLAAIQNTLNPTSHGSLTLGRQAEEEEDAAHRNQESAGRSATSLREARGQPGGDSHKPR